MQIDLVEAAHVNGDHLDAIGACAGCIGRYAAGFAKGVVNIVAVELVIGQILGAFEELELTFSDET